MKYFCVIFAFVQNERLTWRKHVDYKLGNETETTMTYQGYEFEKTSTRRWYVTSRKYGNVFGQFSTRKAALDYAKRIDAA